MLQKFIPFIYQNLIIMLKIITTALLLLFSVISYSQNTAPSNQFTKEEYLKKSRTQKTIGFVMLGAGAATLIAISSGNTDLNSIGTFVVLGSGLVVGSIPLFIAAGRNKRKSKNATAYFKFETTQLIQMSAIRTNTIPAVAIKIRL